MVRSSPPPPLLSLSLHHCSVLRVLKATLSYGERKEVETKICSHAWESNLGPPAQKVIAIKSRHLLALLGFFTDQNDNCRTLYILQQGKLLLLHFLIKPEKGAPSGEELP